MAVWKRFNGKRIKGEGPKGKGIWIVEFHLRGLYIKQAIPEARTPLAFEKPLDWYCALLVILPGFLRCLRPRQKDFINKTH